MKKIKFLLFACLAFSMVLLVSADATAQEKKDHPKQKQSFKTLELKQDVGTRVSPTLKSNSQARAQKLATATAKQQARQANRGEKQTRTNAKLSADNVSAKAKAKRGLATQGTLKMRNTPTNVQLKTIPRNNVEEKKQKRQARIAELRKKSRNQ